ncbi:MAG: DUF1566 domain-containing protein [Pseudomonadales bacterium]|nr:DUF1566 domain-containing protein [Pseudomonadales bacterium]
MQLNKTMATLLTVAVLSPSVLANCNNLVLLVKPDSIYTDHKDGTVTDTQTGLMWQKCALGYTWDTGSNADSPADDSCTDSGTSTFTWHAAITGVNANEFVYTNWHLPNIKELESLVEGACHTPAINDKFFPTTVSSETWTSSPFQVNTAWIVDFSIGMVFDASKNSAYPVRLVRVNPDF